MELFSIRIQRTFQLVSTVATLPLLFNALYIPYDLLVIFLYIRGQYGMHDQKRIFLVLVHFKPQMKVPHVGMCRTPHELARFQAGKEIRVVYFLFLRGNCTAAVLPSPAASGGL